MTALTSLKIQLHREKHSESADLRQAAHEYAKIPKFALSHNDKESFKKILDPEGDLDQHQKI